MFYLFPTICESYDILQMAEPGADASTLIDDKCDLDMRYILKRMSSPRKERATAGQALDIIESKQEIVSRLGLIHRKQCPRNLIFVQSQEKRWNFTICPETLPYNTNA